MFKTTVEDAKAEFSRLLEHWKEIELWLKKAEQVNGKAIIPAINELRYASRQLFNAVALFDNIVADPTPINLEIICRRLIVAQQYLLNADNDIADSIITLFRLVVTELDMKYGPTLITGHFPNYPLFKKKLAECEELISQSRRDYTLRIPNYAALRKEHFPFLIEMHELLVEAEVSAKEEAQRTQRAVKLAEGRAGFAFWFGIVGGIIGILGFVFAIYTWRVSGDKYCEIHGKTPIMNLPCGIQ